VDWIGYVHAVITKLIVNSMRFNEPTDHFLLHVIENTFTELQLMHT